MIESENETSLIRSSFSTLLIQVPEKKERYVEERIALFLKPGNVPPQIHFQLMTSLRTRRKSGLKFVLFREDGTIIGFR